MSVCYDSLRALVNPECRDVSISFTLRNDSLEWWRAADGFAVGCQWFDPASGRFLKEGEWSTITRDLGPGAAEPCELRAELPSEPGDYHGYISPRTSSGWFYGRGEHFVLASVRVEPDRNVVTGKPHVVSLDEMARGRILDRVATPVARMIEAIVSNAQLIRSMTRRDIAARYRGSFAGSFWSIIHPLLLMLTYFFVFGVVLRTKFAGDPSPAGFALYFLAGMLPWLAFSEAVARAPGAMLENRHLVKKVVFPLEIIPVSHTLAGLSTQMVAACLFLAALLILRGSVPLTALLLPLVILPQLLLTVGTAWALAAIGVFLRDLAHIIGFLLTLLFFLTPICYPEHALPVAAQYVLRKNPIFMHVRAWRALLLEGTLPETKYLIGVWLAGIAAFLVGTYLFRRLRRSFADVI